jgi:hypothetical protein
VGTRLNIFRFGLLFSTGAVNGSRGTDQASAATEACASRSSPPQLASAIGGETDRDVDFGRTPRDPLHLTSSDKRVTATRVDAENDARIS